MSNKEDDKLLDHEYDGIQELDNNLPTWWLWTFFGAIIFSFIYWLHYSYTQDGPTLAQELEVSMAKIEAQRANAEKLANAGAAEMTPEQLAAAGAPVYKAYCSSCHAVNGGGGVGPNLTDGYWIHGEGDTEIMTKIVNNGVLSKGMPPWKDVLKPNEVKAVVAYVESMRNTNVDGGKPAQGEKVD